MTTPVPSVVSLLICEKVITEAKTNNKTLVNVFDRVEASEFPAVHGPFWIYARLVDAEGDYTFRVEINHLETEKQIARADDIKAQLPNRLQAADFGLHIPAIGFELPGTYEVLIYANDVWIGRTTVSVVQQGIR
jgi:hypothetical protein